jgi:hypothetical protein
MTAADLLALAERVEGLTGRAADRGLWAGRCGQQMEGSEGMTTEPDEAMLWARERAMRDYQAMRDHDYAKWVGDGLKDNTPDVSRRAEAYRAGHAARDAEVAGLRARVAELEGVLEEIGKPDYGYMDIIEAGYPAEKHADYFARMVGWRRRTAHAALKKTFDGK